MTITPVVPTPDPTPSGYKSYITAAAGIIAFGILPLLHQSFPQIPSLDITQVTGALGILVSAGIAFHRFGLSTVAQYILTNIVPVLLPQIEAAVKQIVANEMQKGAVTGVLSDSDVAAVMQARRVSMVNRERGLRPE